MLQYIKLLLIAVFALVPYLNVQGAVKQEKSIDSGVDVEVRQKEVRAGNRKNRDGERVRNNSRTDNRGRNKRGSTVNEGDGTNHENGSYEENYKDSDPNSDNNNALIEEVEVLEYQETEEPSNKKSREERLQKRSNRQRRNIEER